MTAATIGLLLTCWSLFSRVVVGGSIKDISHVVLFMQENRAFDHYYGTVKGIRGFNDRAAPPLPNGDGVFYQPIPLANGSLSYQLPWHVDSQRTSASCMDAPCMDYLCDIAIWNHGWYDSWNTARDAGMGMSYFTRDDLPYYYSLIDAFTIGDQYFQSTFTQTNPNRLHFFTGSNGLSVGKDPVLNNDEPAEGFSWTTVAEVLEAANITWKLYQEVDNFDDNAFAWFSQFKNAAPGTPLHDKGLRNVADLESAFAQDLADGTLPQVSWIVGPTALSEHATNHPAAGEDLSARLIAQLSKYPDMYAKTAFILNYDEGGQFFDHHWSPTPPVSSDDGVSSVRVDQELNGGVAPIGMGFRVPFIVISPWTRGGYVVSQPFDHTSVLRFIEKRFNVHFSTISDWRRAVGGDLTSTFDFNSFDLSWPDLPSTIGYVNASDVQCATLPKPQPPSTQSIPTQEPGIRPARLLPLSFDVQFQFRVTEMQINLTIQALDDGGAAFQCYDLLNLASTTPRKYSVGPHSIIHHTFAVTPSSSDAAPSSYSYSLHGPNGFVRQYAGPTSITSPCDQVDVVRLIEHKETAQIELKFATVASDAGDDEDEATTCSFTVTDNAYKVGGPWTISISVPSTTPSSQFVPLSAGNWYDVSVTSSASSAFCRRYLGRVERQGGTSDPAMQFHATQTQHQQLLGAGVPLPLFSFLRTPTGSHPKNEPILRVGEFDVEAIVEAGQKNKDASRCLNQPTEKCVEMIVEAMNEGDMNMMTDTTTAAAVEQQNKNVGQWSVEDVARHNSEHDAWIIINKQVYDVSSFLSSHPGGRAILLRYAGQDASEMFNIVHSDSARHMMTQFKVGTLSSSVAEQ